MHTAGDPLRDIHRFGKLRQDQTRTVEKTTPALVNSTDRRDRLSSCVPSSSSSWRTESLSGGCDMFSRAAAFRKLSSSATQ